MYILIVYCYSFKRAKKITFIKWSITLTCSYCKNIVYKFIGFRFQKLERRLQLLLFKDAKTRLEEFLKELCDEYGYDCKETDAHIINHPYTQKDIASLIGISRPTLNILLNELKEENRIDFNRKQITIKS